MTYSPSTRQRIADINLGIRVDRAAASVVTGGAVTLYTVAVGKIYMTLFLAECTVDVAGASTAILSHDPTTGTTANLCGSTNIDNVDAGELLTITGLLTDAMYPLSASSVSGAMTTGPVVMTPGEIILTTGTLRVGSFKFSLFYCPIDPGAYVAVA